MHADLRAALSATGGVISRVKMPQLEGQIRWALGSGELVRFLPAVYAEAGQAHELRIKMRAVMEADPDAVVVGSAAATFHGLLEVAECQTIEVASRRLHSRGWLQKTRRQVPVELIEFDSGIRVGCAALTVIDLIPSKGSAIVDTALRSGVRLDHMVAALAATPGRPGNQTRARVLAKSASQPWSAAERVAHEALHAAGLCGWKANLRVTSAAIADIAFVQLKLIIEIDGYRYHGDERAFARDRRRDQDLAVHGWQVVRFAATDVFDDPARFAAAVRRVCKVRAKQLGVPWQ